MNLDRRSLLAAAALLPATVPLSLLARGTASVPTTSPAIIELRQYTLKERQRDKLIALFEREFVAPQNALGALVLGTFRDLDDPDRFVWLRGFASMAAREAALSAFYGGAVWGAHRDEANATMIDSDNVLLLRPVHSTPRETPRPLANWPFVSVDIYDLKTVEPHAFDVFFEAVLAPGSRAAGGVPLATLSTETGTNTFARLPVRENETVFVSVVGWSSADQYASVMKQMALQSGWRDQASPAVLPALMRKPERLRLLATWSGSQPS